MENGGRLGRGQSSWEILELGNWASAATTFSSAASSSYTAIASSSSCSPFSDHPVGPEIGASRFNGDHQQYPYQRQQTHHHLTCLKLGKRPYYGGGEGVGVGVNIGVGGAVVKRERSSAGAGMGVAPRCQVEGCNKALVDAKDYHRRHKVCEMHSKAPKVVVLGAEQRFCQQCSRFHVISEFDDSKRSCRRRLAGHNERRRKSTSDSIMRNPSLESTTMGSRFPYLSPSPGSALSLLSSKASPWISTPDLSSRSSAALHELIAENRATLLARQLFSDRSWHNVVPENQLVLSYVPHQHQVPSQAPTQLADGWNQFQESGSHVTLDLMQTPNSSFEFLSGRSKSKEEEEECCEIWKSLEGTHVKNARLHCLHRSSTRCM